MIKAGELNKRLTFQSYIENLDTIGGITRTWSDSFTRWAKVDRSGGNESEQDGVLVAAYQAEVIVRQDSGNPINETMRIKYEGYYWDILSIEEYGFNEGYKLKIKRRDNNAV